MKRATLLLIAVVLGLLGAACSDDGAEANPNDLTAAEREWCSFASEGGTDEIRWVAIYDAGRSIGINMEVVNARASDLRLGYQDEGMSPDEAVRQTSEDLFEDADFVAACKEAYRMANG